MIVLIADVLIMGNVSTKRMVIIAFVRNNFLVFTVKKQEPPLKTVKKPVIKNGDFVKRTTYVLVRNRTRVNIATREKIIASLKLVLIMVRVIVIVVGSRAIVEKVSLPNIHLLKVSNRNTRTRCEICLKLPIKAPEWRHWRRPGVNFEHISPVALVFLLLTLSR